jgi:flagellar FliL protein
MDKRGVGKRYLKITMELEVNKEEDKLLVENHNAQLRDTVLLLLSSQSLNEINTMEGKLELKQNLLSRMSQILGDGVVRRIYFTEFVVQ